MPPTVKVKSDNDAVAKHREALAQRVIAYFGNAIPDLTILCFFDDADWQPFKDHFGAANRGFYGPIKEDSFSWPVWPDYATDYIFVDDPTSFHWKRVFDHVIYLHGSTCTDDVGLTMTFAHELQHFVQHSTVLNLWAANSLINSLVFV